jgi:uncharacterized membrane protein
MFLHVPLILSAIPPGPAVKAEIVDSGTDKDAYKVGDRATVRISIKNTGDRDITKVEVRAAIEKEFLGNFVKVMSDHIQVPIYRIRPGETETYKQTATIPNFPGKYRVGARVIANGQEIGDFQKTIEVTR